MYKVWKLKSDNCNGLITNRAFKTWVQPSMSTGDWHTHTKTIVEVETLSNVMDNEYFEDEHDAYEASKCSKCGRHA